MPSHCFCLLSDACSIEFTSAKLRHGMGCGIHADSKTLQQVHVCCKRNSEFMQCRGAFYLLHLPGKIRIALCGFFIRKKNFIHAFCNTDLYFHIE